MHKLILIIKDDACVTLRMQSPRHPA